MKTIRQRHLPHWDFPDSTFFVTACLAGSIPALGLLEIERCRNDLLGRPCPSGTSLPEWKERCWKKVFVEREKWLDHNPAVRHLADPELAKIVADAIYFFAGQRYDLLAYVIMPSHFHWVFHPVGQICNLSYDSRGQITNLSYDSRGQITNLSYDSRGQITNLSYDSSGQITNPSYDSSGQITNPSYDSSGQITNPSYDSSGQITNLSYDSRGQITNLSYDAGRNCDLSPAASPETPPPKDRLEICPTNRPPREKIMQSIKRYSARLCNQYLERSGTFWQEESYDHTVRDLDELGRVIEYIENNPVKAGLVKSPEQWPFSSARDRILQKTEFGEALRHP